MSATCWSFRSYGVPSGSGESWFEPRRGNSKRDAAIRGVALRAFSGVARAHARHRAEGQPAALSLRRLVLPDHSPVHNPKLSLHRTRQDPANQRLDAESDFGERRRLGETDYYDAAVLRWVKENRIAKVEIEGDEATLFALNDRGESVIVSSAE